MNTSNHSGNRDTSFEALRGIAIIAIVAMHAAPIQAYKNFPFISYRQLLNFAVPAFVFISGYWAADWPINSLEDYKNFLTKRLSRVMVPYLFWSAIYSGYDVLRAGKINIYKDVFLHLLTGGATPFWFIVLIIQFYICTPVFQYLNRKHYGLALVFLLNMIYLSIQYPLCLHGITADNWFIEFHLPIFSFAMFYQAGLWMRSHYDQKPLERNIRSIIWPAILLCILLSILEAAMIMSYNNNWRMANYPLKFSSFFYSIFVVFGFMLLRERVKNWPKFLVIIGNYSFGIFLIHMIVLRGIGMIKRIITENSLSGPLGQIVIILMTLLICFVIIRLARKLLPKTLCRGVFGF
ncbi:MAG: acyltransferase [Sedimentisphaerales bacterium]|nr:acyltransferase [Sedimentisphaerales bacterium]